EPFMAGTIESVQNRALPMLVDLGGKPLDWQIKLLQHCTHAILLISDAKNTLEMQKSWLSLFEKARVPLVAQLTSSLQGEESITQHQPYLIAHLTHLERDIAARSSGGAGFEAVASLVAQKIANSPSAAEMYRVVAPAQFVSLPDLAREFGASVDQWVRTMLPKLSVRITAGQPLAVYGRAPNWVYSMLAAHADQTNFWQFDSRLGWIQPPPVYWSEQATQSAPWEEVFVSSESHTVVNLITGSKFLAIDGTQPFVVSRPPTHLGIILYGKLTLWLFTALTRHFQTDYPWVACYQPSVGAVVVATNVSERQIGDLIPESEIEIVAN
ncbi:MAG: CRISPR-associated protein Csx3, partial [Candidatus Promineifilaceae bacterium]